MRTHVYAHLAAFVCLLFLPVHQAHAQAKAGSPAPAFSLTGVDGRAHTAAELRGRPSVLFFFCGCPWCHDCLAAWLQRDAAKADRAADGTRPATRIIFSGDLPATRAYVEAEGVAPDVATVLADPGLNATRRYGAVVCPRVFVLDAGGRVEYTNDHKEDAAREAPATTIVSRALEAWKRLQNAALPPGNELADESAGAGALTIAATEGVTVPEPGTAQFDFGVADALAKREVSHVFTLRNNSAAPVVIERLQGSCACVTVSLEGQPAPDSESRSHMVDQTVPPGKEARVRVAIDLGQLYSGPAYKAGLVYVRGVSSPVATLAMRGSITQPVEFSPPLIGFGAPSPGSPTVRTVSVRLDPRLAGNGAHLACSNPDIQIAASPDVATGASFRGGADAAAWPVRSYTLTLSPSAPIGPVTGALFITRDPDKLLHAIGRAAVVVGDVSGDVYAVPRIISVAPHSNAPATRRLMLVGPEAALRNLKAEASAPWFAVRITGAPQPFHGPGVNAAADGVAQFAIELEVTLTEADIPAGPVQERIIVTLGDGRRLVVPVVGR